MALARGETADADVGHAPEAARAASACEGSSNLLGMQVLAVQRAAGNRAAIAVADRLGARAPCARVLARSTSLLTELYATQAELLEAIGNTEGGSMTQESLLEELRGVSDEIAEEQARFGTAAATPAEAKPSVTDSSEGPSARSGMVKQYSDLVAIGRDRLAYALKNAANARRIGHQFEAGEISAQAAEEAAVGSRRALEASTRAGLPGPEPAKTLSDAAAARNIREYGDPLGFRDPEHLRSVKPEATTRGMIRSSGRPNLAYTSGSVAAGALGVIGGVLAVGDISDQLAGRVEVELEGLDPRDFELDQEWRQVLLGEDEKGTEWHCTIRVEHNLFFRKRFYVVDVYLTA